MDILTRFFKTPCVRGCPGSSPAKPLYAKDEDYRGVRCPVSDELGDNLMTASALEILRGPHDAAMQGAPRYDKKELRSKLEEAGFEVVRLSYFFMSTFPAIYWKRRRENRRAARNPDAVTRSDLEPVPRWLNRLLYEMLRVEAAWASRRDLPIGSSIIALARKKRMSHSKN